MMQIKEKVSFIGVGRLGSALVKAMYRADYTIAGIIDQDLSLAKKVSQQAKAIVFSNEITKLPDCDIIFIAVPDDEVATVVSFLLKNFKNKKASQFVFHTSGALTSEIFNPLFDFDVNCASVHPIQTLSGKKNDWKKLQKIYFGLEGSPTAIEKASEIIDALNGHTIIIPKKQKSLYHLACTIASNYVISLMVPVTELFGIMNFSEQETLKIIHPLLLTTLSNVKNQKIEDALTGPVSRGDAGTVEKHLEILSKKFPDYKLLYQLLGKILLDLKPIGDRIPKDKYHNMEKLLNGKGLRND